MAFGVQFLHPWADTGMGLWVPKVKRHARPRVWKWRWGPSSQRLVLCDFHSLRPQADCPYSMPALLVPETGLSNCRLSLDWDHVTKLGKFVCVQVRPCGYASVLVCVHGGCEHIHSYMHSYVCVYVYIHVHTSICIYMQTCTCKHVFTMYVWKYMYVIVWYVYTYIFTYIQI